MKLRLATENDRDFIELIYKQNPKEIGSFNLFWSWDDYLAGKSPYKYYVLEDVGMMRFGYSKQLKCYTIKEIGILESEKGKGKAAMFFENIPKPLYLTCNENNIAANKFYKKVGMRFAGKKKTKNKGTIMNIWVM